MESSPWCPSLAQSDPQRCGGMITEYRRFRLECTQLSVRAIVQWFKTSRVSVTELAAFNPPKENRHDKECAMCSLATFSNFPGKLRCCGTFSIEEF